MQDQKEIQPSLERELNPYSIGIATATLYPNWYKGPLQETNKIDKIRGDLALNTVQKAVDKGFQVVVVDGGSSIDFQDTLRDLGVGPKLEKERGMSPARRQAFLETSGLGGVGIVCWTEPEKVEIVEKCLPKALEPILAGEADIVVPQRNEAAYSSYPSERAAFEKKGNKLWNQILRKHNLIPPDSADLDVFFGPKFFRNDPDVLEVFFRKFQFNKRDVALDSLVNPELWPNALFLPIVNALAKKLRVVSAPVSFIYPHQQKELEEANPDFTRKSNEQLKNIIASTIHLVRALEGNSKSRIAQI